MMKIFFFSSRRRHTRWTGDWSSDVCSSDLFALKIGPLPVPISFYTPLLVLAVVYVPGLLLLGALIGRTGARSEERRVGKECRSRGLPYHKNNKIHEDRCVAISLNTSLACIS